MEAVVAFDGELIVTAWDAAAERLFGWTADEAIGRAMWDVLPGDGDRMGRLRALRRDGWKGVVVVAAKDNSHVPIECDVTHLRGPHGEISYRAVMRELPESAAYRASADAELGLPRLGEER